ncbi:MAG TPA: hypothetical protein GXX40_01490 [Firmicutes bacterium]|nr:hypothetical protein [Bacillota bacterium]
MEDAGADAIVAEGTEAGGHVSNRMTSIVLIPAVRDAVKIPVIAAGGIADARGVVAAFALGADAVQMGTRFLCSRECIVHPRYKKAIAEAKDDCTVVTGIALGNPLRSLANQFSRLQERCSKSSTFRSFGRNRCT